MNSRKRGSVIRLGPNPEIFVKTAKSNFWQIFRKRPNVRPYPFFCMYVILKILSNWMQHIFVELQNVEFVKSCIFHGSNLSFCFKEKKKKEKEILEIKSFLNIFLADCLHSQLVVMSSSIFFFHFQLKKCAYTELEIEKDTSNLLVSNLSCFDNFSVNSTIFLFSTSNLTIFPWIQQFFLFLCTAKLFHEFSAASMIFYLSPFFFFFTWNRCFFSFLLHILYS